VNWYAHAVVAERRLASPLAVLGAMLPDLASALRVRLAPPPDAAIAAGVRLHGETDAAFHAAPGFLALQAEGREHLLAAGLARGAARAAAHVGIELALDGWLARRSPRSTLFRAAVDAAAALAEPALLFRAGFDATRWDALCARLRHGELPEAFARPERCAQGVERALEPRPRLALGPGDREAVARWLRESETSLADRAPDLLARVGACRGPRFATLAGSREVPWRCVPAERPSTAAPSSRCSPRARPARRPGCAREPR
jgi:hypothetical protein